MSRTDRAAPTVLYYCQHVVGLGHLVRSMAVAAALARDYRVVLLSGGSVPAGISAPEGIELVVLPGIGSADGVGRELVSLDPAMTIEQAWECRTRILLDCLEDLRPAVIMVELFPLGRRQFARELLPLLGAARLQVPRPVVICSVRDLLVANKARQQRRDDQAADRLNAYFDAVVVHADPGFARLEDTFRPSVAVIPPVRYSGFVVPRADRPPGDRSFPPEVLISAGGGRNGGPLFHAAIEAHRLFFGPRGITTRLVTGPFLPDDDSAALTTAAIDCPGLSLERVVPDLCALMVRASVSVSHCGYNTALDLLRAGVAALVVPYDGAGETEQAERARRLAGLGVLRVLPASQLSPTRLAEEVLGLLTAVPAAVSLDLDGARTTASIIGELVRQPLPCPS